MGFFTKLDHMASDLTRLRYLFVNLYFWGTPDSWVLIDAGLKGAAPHIIDAAKKRFGAYAKPRAIILTHGHFDHVGAFPNLFAEWDVPVYAHELELPYLTGKADYEAPDPTVGRGLMAMSSFLYPRKACDLGNRVRTLPSDGSVPFMPGWRWIHTPGHAHGHVSLFRDYDCCLIAGDAFVSTKQESLFAVMTQAEAIHGPPAYFTPDWAKARDSVERLAALNPSIAATGHGTPLKGERLQRELGALAADFENLAVPRHGRYANAYRRSRT